MTTKPEKRRTRDGSLDNFVMFKVGFLLNDMRAKRLSDCAWRVYSYLAASVIAHRREILPPELDAEAIAWDMHKDNAEVASALEELGAGPRPLVELRDDGRIRVVDQRKVAGNRFKWCDEPELSTTSNDSTTIVERSSNDDASSCNDRTTTSQEVEEDVEGEKDVEARTSSCNDPLPIMLQLTADWNEQGQTDHKVWCLRKERLFDHTTDVLAYTLWLNERKPPPTRPWRVLKQHIEKRQHPTGCDWTTYVQRARELVPDPTTGRPPKKRRPAKLRVLHREATMIGSVLGGGNGASPPG